MTMLHPAFSALATIAAATSLLFSNTVQASDALVHRKLQMAPEGLGFDGEYIVFLKVVEETNAFVRSGAFTSIAIDDFTSDLGASTVKRTFSAEKGVRGISISSLDNHEELLRILNRPDVVFVEQNEKVETYATQIDPPWGLDRISQEDPTPLNQRYEYGFTGNGVNVYVLDTGIMSSHEDFSNRVTCGINLVADEDCNDGSGHGTHVAGIIGGTTKGVAKEVNLITVKVVNALSEGSKADMLEGMYYVLGEKEKNPSQTMVANLSIGLGRDSVSNEVDKAIEALVAAGVVVTVAAGNHNFDACRSSPARASRAITVAALGRRDRFVSTSNYGSCVDIFAPGEHIESNWVKSMSANSMSGTSTAAPHVAGVAAMLLEEDKARTPAEITSKILSDALPGKVQAKTGQATLLETRNLLLNTQALSGSSEEEDENTCSRNRFDFGCSSNDDCCSSRCFFRIVCI